MRHLPVALVSMALASLALTGCADADAGSGALQGQVAEPSVTSSAPLSTKAPQASTPQATPTTSPESPSKSARPESTRPVATPRAKAIAAAPTSRPKPRRSGAATSAPGAYVEYAAWSANRAAYSSGDVVLFFHASWCPKCRDTDASAKSGMPAGLTLVKVDYDGATELRQKYGVTLQHTFVQIDGSGKTLKKWVGTYDDNGVAWVKAQTV